MPEITFKQIDESHYRDAIKLKVRDDQTNFVAPNDRSLLQSAYDNTYKFMRLSYNPDNKAAKKLYASVGFVEAGIKEEWGEMVAALDLTK